MDVSKADSAPEVASLDQSCSSLCLETQVTENMHSLLQITSMEVHAHMRVRAHKHAFNETLKDARTLLHTHTRTQSHTHTHMLAHLNLQRAHLSFAGLQLPTQICRRGLVPCNLLE